MPGLGLNAKDTKKQTKKRAHSPVGKTTFQEECMEDELGVVSEGKP